MSIYLLGLGSNINPEANLDAADQLLRDLVSIVAVSPVIATSPVGETFHFDFCNQLMIVRTHLPPPLLKHKLLKVEEQLGRQPKCPSRKTEDRTIDIDIIDHVADTNQAQEMNPISTYVNLNWTIEETYYRHILTQWRDQLA